MIISFRQQKNEQQEGRAKRKCAKNHDMKMKITQAGTVGTHLTQLS